MLTKDTSPKGTKMMLYLGKKKPHISMSLLHIHSEVLKTKLYPYLQLSPLSNRVIFSLKS